MTTATASVVDVPRTDNAIRGHNNSGQCTPMPLPALGTQRITQGNGTSVGTVISLSCPDRHQPVGEMKCVWGSNSTQWSGDAPWCEPLPQVENFGLLVAVLASVVSSVIILLMSMAFITCCLLDCVKKAERKNKKRDASLWNNQPENRSSCYYHKGRNNNNNTQEKDLPLWDNHDPALCDRRACRCHQQNRYPLTAPSSDPTADPALPSAPLPCRGYDQPGRPEPPHNHAPPRYPGPPSTSGLLQSSVLPSSSGPALPHGGQDSGVSVLSRPFLEDSHRTNGQPLDAQECSVRVCLCEVTNRK